MAKHDRNKQAEDKPQVLRASGIDREIIGEGPLPSFYANDTQVMTTPWDMRLSFGVIAEVDPEKGRALVRRLCEVRMSPSHAKRLLQVLVGQIEMYEKTVGTIAVPSSDA